MSQVDKLNYLPLLFWFLILILIFYFLVFSFLLPLLFSSLKTRGIFFFILVDDIVGLYGFDFNLILIFIKGFNWGISKRIYSLFVWMIFLKSFFIDLKLSNLFELTILQEDISKLEEDLIEIPEE